MTPKCQTLINYCRLIGRKRARCSWSNGYVFTASDTLKPWSGFLLIESNPDTLIFNHTKISNSLNTTGSLFGVKALQSTGERNLKLSYVEISNSNVTNADASLFSLSPNSSITIDNCIITKCSSSGSLIYLPSQSNLIISNSYITQNVGTGYAIKAGVGSHINASNLVIDNNGAGIISSGGENSIFDSLTVTNNSGIGISLSTGNNSSISNTTIDNNADIGLFIGNITGTQITDVTVTNNSGTGMHFNGGANATVSNSEIKNNTGFGLYLNHADNLLLDSTEILNNDSTGFYAIYGRGCTLKRSTISNNKNDGIAFKRYAIDGGHNVGGSNPGDDLTIDSCIVSNNTNNGINVGMAHNTSISNTKSQNNGSFGFYILESSSVSNIIDNCEFNDNGNGAVITGEFEINNSTFNRNTSNGLQIPIIKSDGKIIISDCHFDNNKSTGVSVSGNNYGNNISFYNCTVNNNNGYGIYNVGGLGTVLSMTEMSNNTFDGYRNVMQSWDSTHIANNQSFTDCHSLYNGGYGIYIENGNNISIVSSELSFNQNSGLYISDGGQNINIENTKILNNSSSGVIFADSYTGGLNSTIKNSMISFNNNYGIKAGATAFVPAQTSFNVQSSSITNNSNVGLWVGTGTNSNISNSVFAENSYGLYIYEGNATISSSTFAHNFEGIHRYSTSSSLTVTNSICTQNSSQDVNYNDNRTNTLFNYSIIGNLPLMETGVDGLYNQAPQFVDTRYDYRLKSSSLGVNDGNPTTVDTGTDYFGNQRIIGDTIDMGYYEYSEGYFELVLNSGGLPSISGFEDTPVLIDTLPDNYANTGIKFELVDYDDSLYKCEIIADTLLYVHPHKDINGLGAVTIMVKDTITNQYTYTDIVVNLSPQNDTPVLTSVIPQEIGINSSLNIVLSMTDASDVDNDSLTIVIQNGSNYTVNKSTITPTLNFTGSISVPIAVTDGVDTSAFVVMSVNIKTLEFTSTPIVNASINTFYEYEISTTPYSNITASLPNWLSLDSTYEVSTMPFDSSVIDVSKPSISDITFAKDGTMYILSNYSIYKVLEDGKWQRFVGVDSASYVDGDSNVASFVSPSSMVFDEEGNLFVTDFHRIRKVTPLGNVSTLTGKEEAGSQDGKLIYATFWFPDDIAINSRGELFVTEYVKNRIRKISPSEETFQVTTKSGFTYPKYIAFDNADRLYVSEQHKISRLSQYIADYHLLAGSGESGYVNANGESAQFSYQNDIVIDADNNVIVADGANHCIRLISTDKNVTTLAGTGEMVSIDGEAQSASFTYPRELAISPAGAIFIVESNTSLIRILKKKYSLSGTPQESDIGNNNVVITANDSYGNEVKQSFTISVDDGTAIIISDPTAKKGIDNLVITPNPVERTAEGVNFIIPTELTGNWKIIISDALGNILDEAEFEAVGGTTYTWDLHSMYGVRVASGSYVLIAQFTDRNGRTQVFRRMIGVKQ